MVLALLWAGMTHTHAQDYKPNMLFNAALCADSDAWQSVLAELRTGDATAAHRMMTFFIGSGRCVQLPVAQYRPEAIVQEWPEDDGSGTPGVIVAGHLINQDGSQGQAAFGWFTPGFLKEYFGIEKPQT